ncbi:MAG: sulfatase-like hydrolase/transferase, partial [bacterium]|nr:sulfatase-like hydrolase/transferase [bacterium]
VFERAYAQANQTRFSVPSYMTGRYFPVFATSGGGWREMFRTPPEEEQLLPAILRDNGYETAVASAHPWVSNDESRLWGSFDEGYYRGGELAGLNQWVFSWLEKRSDRPFFLYIHATDTHFPHYPRPGHDEWIDRQAYRDRHSVGYSMDGKTFTEAEQEVLRALHDGSIHYADACIGELTEKLASLSLLENTILIVDADHGDALAEDGVTLGHTDDVTRDEVFHVPLVMAGPGIPRGCRVNALVENVDVVPTLIQLLQLDTTA